MGKAIDMTGMVFGKLTVIKRDKNPPKKNNSWWICQCECGNIKSYPRPWLIKGSIKSCGCQQHKTHLRHRKTHLKEYEVWKQMKRRCYNQNYAQYKDYGGRNIKICESWLSSFDNFFEDMGPCPKDHFIDRVNNDGDYEPSNCKWKNRTDQNRNRRSVRLTKDIADTIREMYQTKLFTHKELANLFSCSENLVWQIIHNYIRN
jgi:hypothetical protein